LAATALSSRSYWTRRRVGAVAIQGVVLAAVAALLSLAAVNVSGNLERLGAASGFGFLWHRAGFAIEQHLIPYSEDSTYFRAFLVAVLNTLVLAVVALVIATVVGFCVGLGRRSSNGLVHGIATAYVETLRNIPLLLQLFFWYFAMLRPLPAPRQSVSLFGIAFLSNRGLVLPAPVAEPGFGSVLLTLAIGVLLALIVTRSLAQRRARTGSAPKTWPLALALVLGPPLVAAVATGFPLRWEIPHLQGFNFQGGITVLPEFVAMALALSLYSASYVAEIVRAGLDAVPRGQIEAARALGLKSGTISAKITIPQALRVIVPPLGNEYLRLLRNTTLAAAIAYSDLTQVFGGTVLNQTAQALEVMAMVAGTYLVINAAVSALLNWYNRRVAWVQR
jgi:general L-amino acid transport system permease protein